MKENMDSNIFIRVEDRQYTEDGKNWWFGFQAEDATRTRERMDFTNTTERDAYVAHLHASLADRSREEARDIAALLGVMNLGSAEAWELGYDGLVERGLSDGDIEALDGIAFSFMFGKISA